MTVYPDTSFLVSAYVQDQHSKAVDQMLSSGPEICITSLHMAEWMHAIAQHVFRKAMSATEAAHVYREFENDCSAGVWITVDLPEVVFDLCADLGRRYGPKLGVRTLDSLHVACALALKLQVFWTFDDRQLKLARALGLKAR